MYFYFLCFILIAIGCVMVARPLSVFLHELGHAVPMALLTRKPVVVYIGTYGSTKNCKRIKVGLFTFFIKYNILYWQRGLCVPTAKETSLNRRLLWTIGGPITSLIFAAVACYMGFYFELHGFVQLFLVVFLASAIFDFFINLIPNSNSFKLDDGRTIFNDGHTLKLLLYYKMKGKAFMEPFKCYDEQKFAEAANLFEKQLSKGICHEEIYRFLFLSYFQDKNYKKALDSSILFLERFTPQVEDLINIGTIYLMSEKSEDALVFYDRALLQCPANALLLNNKGYALIVQDLYADAIPILDKAIELDDKFVYAWNNRGLAKIKTGQIDDGLKDIQTAISLDDTNPYGYRNLGIYHFDKGEYKQALALFKKSENIDPATHMIEELIKKTKSLLN